MPWRISQKTVFSMAYESLIIQRLHDLHRIKEPLQGVVFSGLLLQADYFCRTRDRSKGIEDLSSSSLSLSLAGGAELWRLRCPTCIEQLQNQLTQQSLASKSSMLQAVSR